MLGKSFSHKETAVIFSKELGHGPQIVPFPKGRVEMWHPFSSRLDVLAEGLSLALLQRRLLIEIANDNPPEPLTHRDHEKAAGFQRRSGKSFYSTVRRCPNESDVQVKNAQGIEQFV